WFPVFLIPMSYFAQKGNYTRLTAWSFTPNAMHASSMPLPTSLISEIPSNKGDSVV
ncbi:Endoplasmic reticulum metallopeptidase 1, partial [Schistosoma japonicum]